MHFLKALAVVAGAILAAAALAVSASGSSSGGSVVKVGSSSLGRVLVDAHGKTLYIWAHDKGAKSTCNGDCAEYWPPLITRGRPIAVGGARASLLGTSRRGDGRIQATYAGHPLYYFVKDAKPGQTNGEGLAGFGGRWDPVSAAGAAVRKSTDSTADGYGQAPLKATVLSPRPNDSAGIGGTFTVDLSLEATAPQSNRLLAGYTAAFNDPTKPTFHPDPTRLHPGSSSYSRQPRQWPALRYRARTRTSPESSRSTTSRRRTARPARSTAGSSPCRASSARPRPRR